MSEESYYFLYNNKQNKIIKYIKDDVMHNLYFLLASLPTEKQMKDHISKYKDEITDFINKYGIIKSIKKIKKSISKIDNRVPLYDIYSENIYIIDKNNVYYRVTYNYYRFPTIDLIQNIEKKRNNLIIKMKNIEYSKNEKILKTRKIKKMDLTLQFLSYFDIKELYDTYIKIFYLYSDEVGQNITVCQRPSFVPHLIHIKPYYTKNEIINLGLNMNLVLENECENRGFNNTLIIKTQSLQELCQIIKNNDISAKILLKHQEYMIMENKVGLVQYYSLHGSYFINQYLRNMVNYEYKNEYLEKIITSMWKLVNKSPKFDKDYIVYRFINNDSYLRNLDIGDIYTEPSFMSTTRDPFYRSDLYNFGFVLLKIKIPKNIEGIGLCVETLSHFPMEQEIILSPRTMLKLIKRDENCKYYHTNKKFVSQIKTRYEFEYVGKGDINFQDKEIYDGIKEVDFLTINSKNAETLGEKIDFFIKNNLNPMYQCNVRIGDKIFTLISEFFDSSGAYKNFYALDTKKGFSMYSFYGDYILFFIEIGQQNNINMMHVDYNRKYTVVNRENIISDEDFVYFISTMANYFGIIKTIVYSEYITCDYVFTDIASKRLTKTEKNASPMRLTKKNIKQREFSKEKDIEVPDIEDQKYYGGRYCLDLYNYLNLGKKRYEHAKILSSEINPKYSYYMLDKLKKERPSKILEKEDNDELYQIYYKTYINDVPKEKDTVKDFMTWVIKNKCYLIEVLVSKLKRIYKSDNPFEHDYYILDSNTFLYNRGYIQTYPKYIMDTEFKLKRNVSIIPMNEYKHRFDQD